MPIEVNNLVKHFTNTSFKIEGIYHYVVEPGQSGCLETAPFAGFIFPLGGQAEFDFNGTTYMAGPQNVIHGGARMNLRKRVVGNTKWEYILVLYNEGKTSRKEMVLADTHFELVTGQSARLTDLLRRLWRLSSQPGAIPAFQTETMFRCVLEEIFVCARNLTNDGAQALFEQVSAYIHEYYMDSLTVRRLAVECPPIFVPVEELVLIC
ncbi:MAG: hypothetical protein ACK5L3_07115 [Oscillospiraceae bacterium]